jgi:hypothetical protein
MRNEESGQRLGAPRNLRAAGCGDPALQHPAFLLRNLPDGLDSRIASERNNGIGFKALFSHMPGQNAKELKTKRTATTCRAGSPHPAALNDRMATIVCPGETHLAGLEHFVGRGHRTPPLTMTAGRHTPVRARRMFAWLTMALFDLQ